MADDSVLVAGGGIAGLALARALRLRGVRAVLSERETRHDRSGLAIILPGNAVAAIGALGLGAGLERIGRPTRRRDYRSANGKLLFTVDEDEFWGPEARPRCVRRSDLLTLLDSRTTADHRRPSVVDAVRLTPFGAEVRLGDGRRERHGFVAGADGARSAVRSSVFGASRDPSVPTASWRFMVTNPGVDCWTAWTGPEGTFVLIPVDGHEAYAHASATRGGPVATDPTWLGRVFGSFADPVRAALDSVSRTPDALHHTPVEEVRLTEFARGRCALIGDAAHASVPVWAQGAALALEDALVLAELLATADWDAVAALYQERRRERVAHVQAVTDRQTRADNRPAWVRQAIAPVLGRRNYVDAYARLREPV